MPPELERIQAFVLGEIVLVKHYFEADPVFHELKSYYNNSQYRFEIPRGEIDDLQPFLKRYGYRIDLVHDTDPFVVLKRKYTPHPENIFKESVIQRSEGNYNFFLMTDQIAVAKAVDEGATRLTNTPLNNPFHE